MDRLASTYLLMFSCYTFVWIYGRGQALLTSCEVEVNVWSGTTWRAVPKQRLTVRCPVKHCGESPNVTWCKLLDGDKCEQINHAENVEIRQNDSHVKNELISFLTFKRISIRDDGLYRCHLKGYKYAQISHIINISVSDLNQGVKNPDYKAYELNDRSVASKNEEDISWLPYFSICVCIALLVITLTVVTLLSFYCRKPFPTNNHSKKQDMSTQMIPDLPKGSSPSTLVLQTHFSVLNDIYSPSPAERPPARPSQAEAPNTADQSRESDCVVYTMINHPKTPAKEQHAEMQNALPSVFAEHF
ncbi:B- and T-lymphocyte attenuator-like [Pempheris klunzingeri]|uniref:B- and T-lymphocyte attenuator-like n=1 Tax=Pempheris klunzingeri TaxID=3127111 RepID=UPI003980C142